MIPSQGTVTCWLLVAFVAQVLGAGSLKSLAELFVVQSQAPGDCSGQVNQLNTFVSEAYDMATNALSAIAAYSNDQTTQQTLATMLGIQAQGPDLEDVEAWILDVQEFLTGEFIPDASGQHPKMYCDDTYLSIQNPTDVALDSDGNPVQRKGVDQMIQNIHGSFLLPGRNPDGTTYTPWPYWNRDLNIYEFGPDWNGNPAHTFCGISTHWAATTTLTTPSTLMFCPRTFTGYQPTLGSRQVQARNMIATVMSRSVIFLHELFHLTRDGDDYDYCNSASECIKAAASKGGFTPEDARSSPECYALVLEGLWFAKHQGFSFATGKAVALAAQVNF